MSFKTNYHTHSTFCDGKNTPEEIVKAAILQQFDILGFSSHSMYPFGELWHIAPNNHFAYAKEITRLKQVYKNNLNILLGFEADYIPSMCEPDFERYKEFNPDFLIGSVHYIVNEKGFFTVDDSIDNVKNGIDQLFNGNGKKAVKEYFYLEREMLKNNSFTILGHADLIRIRNEQLHFFNESESWYKSELKALVNQIAKSYVIVEINTGAISRGTMNDVYPSAYFLELLRQKNVPITICSDAHTVNNIDGNFDKAIIAAKKAGYTEKAVITRLGNIEMVPLE